MSVADKIKISIDNTSWIKKMFEEGLRRKKKYGADNVFDFSIGNPNLEPPARFKEVLFDLLKDPQPGIHGYMPNAGFESTRQALADYLNKTSRPQFTAQEIIMTPGAGAGCNVVFKTILNPGDEVIIPAPYFFEYNPWIENHRGVPRIVSTKPGFQLDCDAISEAITEVTRAVLFNSPNNPSGKVFTKWCTEIVHGEDLPVTIQRAFKVAMQSLWTAARYKIPVTFVITNNAVYRQVKLVRKIVLGDYLLNENHLGMELDEPVINFSLLAESMGVKGERVERPEDLNHVLNTAMDSEEPRLVEVFVENRSS